MIHRKGQRHRHRRSARIESLESRFVFSYVLADWGWGTNPQDDGYTIKKDSEQQALDVLQNDRGYSYYRLEPQTEIRNLKITSDAQHGTAEVAQDGSTVMYRPADDFTGIDRFTYMIDVNGQQMEADVFVNVVEPLFAMRDWFRVDEDSQANELDVLENDQPNAVSHYNEVTDPQSLIITTDHTIEPSTLRITAVSEGSHGGTLSISEDGKRLFHSPAAGFQGLESFTYVIEDEDGYSSEASVQVQVTTVAPEGRTPVWQEQIEQRLLELAVQRNVGQFGNFQFNIYNYFFEDRFIDLPFIDISLNTVDSSVSDARFTSVSDTFDLNSTDFSVTNNQVDGVDEGDLVKTDGQYLYLVSNWIDEDDQQNHQLVIVDVRDAENPTVLSRYAFNGTVESLHLQDDRVTVLSQSNGKVVVTVLDVADRRDPTLAYESTITGTLQATRAIGDYVYVIADTSGSYSLPGLETVCFSEDVGCFYETAAQFVGRIEEAIYDDFDVQIQTRDAEGVVTHEPVDLLTATNPDDLWDIGLSTIVSFDVSADTSGPAETTTLIHGSTSEIYVSANAIYLMNEVWGEHSSLRNSAFFAEPSYRTQIEKLAFGSAGQVDWVASGTVAGHVLNSFSVDEHNGYLRIATNTGSENNLYILEHNDERLEVVGSVEGLADGEQIYSARFDGDRAFVVTFRKVDPLFVFDLSDPADPQVLGQLKVSGYSNYLHVIDENHLLGIGREADGNGLFQEIQISLFDVSDFENPKLLDRYGFEGGRQLWSPVMDDAWNLGTHHAVSYFASHQTLVMPVYEGGHAGWSWAQYGESAEVSMRVLDIDLEDGITALGQVQFEQAFDPRRARSVRIGDVLYSVSPDLVQAHQLRNPENKISEVRVGVGATDDVFAMRGSEAQSLDVLANDLMPGSDESGKKIVSIEQPVAGGRVDMNQDDGTLSFVPDADYLGPAKFSYVMEAGGHREKATVQVNVKRAWHNSGNPMDVNGDQAVTSRDMLQIVNVLIGLGSGTIDELEKKATPEALSGDRTRLVDINNDGNVTARDFLLLVNHFLRQTKADFQRNCGVSASTCRIIRNQSDGRRS